MDRGAQLFNYRQTAFLESHHHPTANSVNLRLKGE